MREVATQRDAARHLEVVRFARCGESIVWGLARPFSSPVLDSVPHFGASDTAQRTRAVIGPGAAGATSARGMLSLFNDAVSGTWKIENGRFNAVSFDDRQNGRRVVLPAAAFALVLDDGRVLQASEMQVTAPPRIEALAGDARASRMVERLPGTADCRGPRECGSRAARDVERRPARRLELPPSDRDAAGQRRGCAGQGSAADRRAAPRQCRRRNRQGLARGLGKRVSRLRAPALDERR